jgi:hypothetical protein
MTSVNALTIRAAYFLKSPLQAQFRCENKLLEYTDEVLCLTTNSHLRPGMTIPLTPKILSEQIWIASYFGQPLTFPYFTIFSSDFLCNSLKS